MFVHVVISMGASVGQAFGVGVAAEESGEPLERQAVARTPAGGR